MKSNYKIWLDSAKSSLAISKKKTGGDILFEDLCFQAQLAVEKAIKGLLIFYGINPKKTNNLILLIRELENYIAVPDEINDIAVLNDYAVQARSPGNYPPVQADEYKEAIRVAENCIEWIKNKIKSLENNN